MPQVVKRKKKVVKKIKAQSVSNRLKRLEFDTIQTFEMIKAIASVEDQLSDKSRAHTKLIEGIIYEMNRLLNEVSRIESYLCNDPACKMHNINAVNNKAAH
jgi:ASC-1-like (ASCH) protein